MNSVFDYVKRSIPISQVIGTYVQLKSRGSKHTGLCPFHGEKTPSFHVDDDKGMYYCFGCKASGDVIKFVSDTEKLDALDACKFIASRYGLDISPYLHQRKKQDTKVYDVLKDAAEIYSTFFYRSNAAKRYAVARGINREAVGRFLIGYAPDGWNHLYNQLRRKYPDAMLLKSGLISESKGRYYDRFRNRLMFPIVDQMGRVVGFGGRTMGNDPAKYLNSSESDHFKKGELLYALANCKDHLEEKKYIIVAEGYMDVVALSIAGINNVVATLGTSMTDGHARLLQRYTNEVILCYDSDKAGIQAALRAIDILAPHIETVRVCLLGEGLDPDDFVKKYGADEFRSVVESSKLAMAFKIDYMSNAYHLNDTASYNNFLRAACHEINKLGDAFERNTYAQYLVDAYQADPSVISKVIGAGKLKRSSPEETAEKPLSNQEQIIKRFVSDYETIIENRNLFGRISSVEFSRELSSLFYALINYFEENRELHYSILADDIGIEPAKRLQELMESEQEPKEMDFLLLNEELIKVNEELKQDTDPERFHELSVIKQTIINDMKQIGERSTI